MMARSFAPTRCCTTCGKEKPNTSEHFPLGPKNAHGYRPTKAECKECRDKYMRPYARERARKARVERENAKLALALAPTRRCTTCGEEKPNTSDYFVLGPKNAHGHKQTTWQCKVCRDKYMLAYRRERGAKPRVDMQNAKLRTCKVCQRTFPNTTEHFRAFT